MTKRWCVRVLSVLLGFVLVLVALAVAQLSLVRAAPGDWSHPIRLGPWHMDASVAAMLRVVTHPVILRAMQDRDFATRHGVWRLHAGTQPDSWILQCAPCRIPLSERRADDVALSRVELIARRVGQSEWQGEIVLGDGVVAVRGRFKSSFDNRGADLRFDLPDTPIAHVYGLFANAMPEVATVHIEGHVRLSARVRLPQRELTVDPVLEGFSVSGLGTAVLLNATPSCEAPRHGFGAWLPRAVIAAEDQRFFEHTGYDIKEIAATLSRHGPAPDAPRGASTISQQLAKLLYTGDARTHVRKLRELLYAVELDRTLGKARVLNLYLTIAPWGEGRCGAVAAARHYLHERVDQLTPTEAAWLASLLHNPDRDWASYLLGGQVDVQRVAWVIANLRPMPSARRESLIDALGEWKPAAR